MLVEELNDTTETTKEPEWFHVADNKIQHPLQKN